MYVHGGGKNCVGNIELGCLLFPYFLMRARGGVSPYLASGCVPIIVYLTRLDGKRHRVVEMWFLTTTALKRQAP